MSGTNGSGYVFDLDGTLDDIGDLPSFTPWPTGAYIARLPNGIEMKDINDHKALTVRLECVEAREVKRDNLDPDEQPPKPGDTADIAFLMDNDTGAGMFKLFATPIANALGTRSNRELIEKSKGLNILIALRRVSGKGDKSDQRYNRVIRLSVL